MFVQISHGNRHKTGKCMSPTNFEESEEGGEQLEGEIGSIKGSNSPMRGGENRKIPGKNDSVIEVSQEMVSPETEGNPAPLAGKSGKKSEQIFERISEKASRFLPKKSSLGKLFGEKEPTITIYTIDKEMNKSTTTSHSTAQLPQVNQQDKFQNPELAHKLKKTRQPPSNFPHNTSRIKSIGIQAGQYPPFRLYLLPPDDWKDQESKLQMILKLLSCQCCLGTIYLLWIVFGALVLHLTENQLEIEQAQELNKSQVSLAVSWATDMRMISEPHEPIWKDTIDKYFKDHKKLILDAINTGYLEEGELWSYAGSFLFVVSLLCILGYGSPLPLSLSGQLFSVFFMLIGLPIHFILVRHLTIFIGLKMHLAARDIEIRFSELKRRVQHARRSAEDPKEKDLWPEEMFSDFYPPDWMKYFPYISLPIYYLFGLLTFGVARDMSFPYVLVYPIDFTERGSLATMYGSTRFFYSCFLEGAIILVALSVFLIQSAMSGGFIPYAIKLGLLTNSID